MKHKIGDTVKCIKDLEMDDDGAIEFTKGKEYEIDDIAFGRYYLFDNSGTEHEMGDDDYFDGYFEPTSGSDLTPEERFDYAMRSI